MVPKPKGVEGCGLPTEKELKVIPAVKRGGETDALTILALVIVLSANLHLIISQQIDKLEFNNLIKVFSPFI